MDFALTPVLFEGQNLTQHQMEAMLEASAYKVFDNYEYLRPLTEDEIAASNAEISRLSVEISKVQTELDEACRPLRAHLKSLNQERQKVVNEVMAEGREEMGKIYELQDPTTSTMHTYDRFGVRIGVRPLLPNERTYRMPLASAAGGKLKNGTDN